MLWKSKICQLNVIVVDSLQECVVWPLATVAQPTSKKELPTTFAGWGVVMQV